MSRDTLSKRIGLVPAVSMLATAIAFGAHHAASADDCIPEPTHQPPDGRHWYYHFDQARNRKCWRLGETGMAVLPESPHPAGPGTDRSGQRQELALSRAQRDTLFQDFIRWNELQRNFQ
jgi:hypothetical protein